MTIDHEVHAERSTSPSSRQGKVQSRTDMSRSPQPQPEALHSELRSGAHLPTDGPSERERTRSARLAPNSFTSGRAGEVQLLRSSLLAQQDAPALMSRRTSEDMVTKSVASAKSSDPSYRQPADKTSGAGGTESDVKEITESGAESSSTPSKPRFRRGKAVPGEDAGSKPLFPPVLQRSAQAEYAASMKSLLFKVYPPAHDVADGGRTLGSTAGRMRQGAITGGRHQAMQQQQMHQRTELPISCFVKLPVAPTQMLMNTSKRSAGVIERVLLEEGYMRSDLLKILDQLSPFQK